MKLLLSLTKATLIGVLLMVSTVANAQYACNVIYVSPSGSPTSAGTLFNPTTIENAVAISEPGDVIKMDTGFYAITSPIYLKDSLTIEGGYIQAQNWVKTSRSGATYLRRFNTNAQGPVTARRTVMFYGDSVSGFRLQDLRIAMYGGFTPGMSKYAIHLNGCSNYDIVRCWIASGPGADGVDGTDGTDGTNGLDGTNGQAGNNDLSNAGGGGGNGGTGGGGIAPGIGGLCCSATAFAGGNGTAPAGLNGGGGAGGGSGAGGANNGAGGGTGGGGTAAGNGGLQSGCNGLLVCGSAESGTDGTDGSDGSDGSFGTPGGAPQLVNGFWIPGTPGTDGTDGTGGFGGGGGGGGAGEGGAGCTDGHGSGGGGGGGGGQAGTAGTGATAGGNSIAIMIVNNGPGGNINDCFLINAAAGQGGSGGNGGIGGAGGSGGFGSNYTLGEVGCGGDGGNGGDGGSGGNGGDAQDGVSFKIYLASGSALANSDTAFDLFSQPEIILNGTYCIDDVHSFTDSSLAFGVPGAGVGVGSWDFDRYTNFAIPTNGTNNPDTTRYTQGGRYSLSSGPYAYEDFVLIQDTFNLPNAGPDAVYCDSTSVQLNGNTPSPGAKGVWTPLGTPATVDEPNNPDSRVSGLIPGSNLFVWTIGNCCLQESDTMEVFINLMTSSIDIQVACDSFQWIDSNWYYTSNNTATDTFTNSVGCDSVVFLDLTVNYTTYNTDFQVACDSFQWVNGNGQWFYSSITGVSDTFTNSVGCDSVLFLDLTVNYSDSTIDSIVACDSLTWIDGITYYADNDTAQIIFPNQYGCDSVITLDLTVNYTNYAGDTIVACDSYTWIDGNTYDSTIVGPLDTLTNSSGCDSIVALNLTILYSTTFTDSITACDSYTWLDGNTYTTNNTTAQHVIPNAVGCDSTITLALTMNYSQTIVDQVTACDTFTWSGTGETYTANKNTSATFTGANGCDSTRVLNLTIKYSSESTDTIEACDSYQWIDGNTYTQDNFSAKDTSINNVGCRHVTSLNLTIETVNNGVYLDTADSVLYAVDTAAGASYVWFRCSPNAKKLEAQTNYFHTPGASGSFAVQITRGACQEKSECIDYIIRGVGIEAVSEEAPYTLFPNPSDGVIFVDLGEDQDVSLKVYSTSGQLIQERENLSGLEQLDLREQPGLYIIELSKDGAPSFYQVIVQK